MELRAGYKQTEVGMIPEDWVVNKLTNVCSMKSGEGITSDNIDQFSKFPCYGGNGLRGFTTRFTHDGHYTLIGRQGALCGNVLGVNGKIFASEYAIVVTPTEKTDVSWLTFVLGEMRLNQYSESSAQPGLSVSKLLDLKVAYPPTKAEQTAIATVLSDVDALLAKLDQLIVKKRDLKQAAMQQLLTGQTRLPGFSGKWEVKRIRDFTDCTAVSTYWGGSIRWMNSGELNLKKVNEVEGRIMEHGLKNSSTKIIPAYCVLVGLAGQGKTRGTVAMNTVELCINQSIAAILPNQTFNSDYLYYYLDSQYEELRSLSTGDGGRGGLNLTITRSVMVPFPKIKEQTAIATILSDMDAEITALEVRRDKTKDLKQGMMQELLTGRIRLIVNPSPE